MSAILIHMLDFVFVGGGRLMFNHWQVFTSFALLSVLACAQQKASQDKSADPVLAVVQTDASGPGDESLNCEGLEKELLASMNDPAVQSHLSRVVAKKQPVATAFSYRSANATATRAKTIQLATKNLQREVKQMNELLTISPQLVRGQRVLQLARARNCQWLQEPESSTGHEAGH